VNRPCRGRPACLPALIVIPAEAGIQFSGFSDMLLIFKDIKIHIIPRQESQSQNFYHQEIINKLFKPFEQFELLEQFFSGVSYRNSLTRLPCQLSDFAIVQRLS
jgi:hypothetical protein